MICHTVDWMRDGALSMRALQETTAASNFTSISSTVKQYIQWVLHVQNEADPNGIDVRIEPKFELPNGEPYTGGWCRPQNDGPGLRCVRVCVCVCAGLPSYGELTFLILLCFVSL